MSTANTTINAAAFNRSIAFALEHPQTLTESIDRVQHMISKLPDEKLYSSNRQEDVIFYTLADGHQEYLSKKSGTIHFLARRKYLVQLLKILELTEVTTHRGMQRREAFIGNLEKMVLAFERGNLNISKIVLTDKQYKWLTHPFEQKRIDSAKALKTVSGLYVRSKSERDIINTYDYWAVPHHYEERQLIYVKPLVDKLEEELQQMGLRTNFIHEHEGMMNLFSYRYHASERVSVMKYTRTVDNAHFLETYEQDIDTAEKVSGVIKRHLLPRLWF